MSTIIGYYRIFSNQTTSDEDKQMLISSIDARVEAPSSRVTRVWERNVQCATSDPSPAVTQSSQHQHLMMCSQ